MFDEDDDGKITIQEMKNTLRAMGEILTEEEIDEAFKSLDIDGNKVCNLQQRIMMPVYSKELLFVE